MIEVEGIVINEIDYRDKSKIIYVLTKNGLISIIAKGCKSPKSILRSCTDKLTYGKFYIKYKENKLSILTNFDSLSNFKNIKKNFNSLILSMYILDLTYKIVKDNFNQNIYFILIDSLKKINENINPLVITNILELKYLDYLGVKPNLDSCSNCSCTKNIVGLSIDKSGLICSNCFENDMLVNEKTIKLIRIYYYIDIKKIDNFNIDNKIIYDINKFIDSYYEKYTGLYLNNKKTIINLLNK